MRRLAVSLVASSAFLTSVGVAHCRIIEEQIRVPVKVVDRHARDFLHEIVVTLSYDDEAPKPYPLLVLNHGRAVQATDRYAMGRARYTAMSRWFTEFGFLVAVPTRMGYGVTGGTDVEESGSCSRKNYPPVFQAAAAQTVAVLETLRQRKDVAKNRAVVVGQSFGGTTAIAVAALNIPGVQAAINFAGGGGGRPDTHPQDPCSPHELRRLFASYGKTARIPTLWLYSENDRYFGPKLPIEWFTAFKESGGVGELLMFPPHGDDGHPLFTRAPDWWQKHAVQFLRPLGYENWQLRKIAR